MAARPRRHVLSRCRATEPQGVSSHLGDSRCRLMLGGEYNDCMSKKLEETIELLPEFSDDRQDDIAVALLAYLAQDAQQDDIDRPSGKE